MKGEHAPGPAYAFAAPAPVPADVGIVAAMSIEVGFLLDRLKNVRKYRGPRQTVIEGECGGKIVALVVTGPGRASARRGALALLDGHRPRWVLSAGFGGGLNPALSATTSCWPTRSSTWRGIGLPSTCPSRPGARTVRSGRAGS